MKSFLTLALAAGLLVSSTSNAFCLKQYSKQQNRFAASLARTNYQPATQKTIHGENEVVTGPVRTRK